MKLSMTHEYYEDMEIALELGLQKAQEFGLEYIECSVGYFEGKDIEHVKKLFTKYGLKLSAINTWHPPKSLQEKADFVLEGIELAGELSASIVVVYYGNLSQQPSLELFKELMAKCLPKAENKGITLVVETEFDMAGKELVRTPQGCLEILRAIDSDYLKLNYDPANTYTAGVEGYPYMYDLLKDYITYVHLKGVVKYDPAIHGSEKENQVFQSSAGKFICVPVGQGATNDDAILNRLAADGYKGFITLEPHVISSKRDETIKAGIEYVRTKC